MELLHSVIAAARLPRAGIGIGKGRLIAVLVSRLTILLAVGSVPFLGALPAVGAGWLLTKAGVPNRLVLALGAMALLAGIGGYAAWLLRLIGMFRSGATMNSPRSGRGSDAAPPQSPRGRYAVRQPRRPGTLVTLALGGALALTTVLGATQLASAQGPVGAAAPAQMPMSIVAATASSSYPGSGPEKAIDGNPNTQWNSGTAAPPQVWIQFDLGRITSLNSVRWLIAQLPAGKTSYQVFAGPLPHPTESVDSFSQVTREDMWLTLTKTLYNVRYVKIVVSNSAGSWVGMKTFEAYRATGTTNLFGYWATAFAAHDRPGYNYTNIFSEVADHSNVVVIAGGSATEDKYRLQAAQAKGLKALVVVDWIWTRSIGPNNPAYAGTDPKWWVNPSATTEWSSYLREIAPYWNTILGFVPKDEPYNATQVSESAMPVVLANLNTILDGIATGIKNQGLAPKKTAMIFDVGYIFSPNFGVPKKLDWAAFDAYEPEFPVTDGITNVNNSGRSLAAYTQRLRERLTTSQQVILVSQAAIEGNDLNVARGQQAALLRRVEQEIAMAIDDPAYAMVMPFLWQDLHLNAYIEPWYGASVLPQVAARYRQIGKAFIRTGGSQAFPMSISATATEPTTAPSYIADDRPSTWNAGRGPLNRVTLDLGVPTNIKKVEFQINQFPASEFSTWRVYVGPDPSTLTLLGTVSGVSQSGQWLSIAKSASGVRVVVLEHAAGSSWSAITEAKISR